MRVSLRKGEEPAALGDWSLTCVMGVVVQSAVAFSALLFLSSCSARIKGQKQTTLVNLGLAVIDAAVKDRRDHHSR